MEYILTYNDKTFKCSFSKTNIHIEDSYKLTNIQDIKRVCKEVVTIGKLNGFNYKRDAHSWAREWVAHNIVYALGILRDRTAAVDLSDNEGIFRLLCYNILAFYV